MPIKNPFVHKWCFQAYTRMVDSEFGRELRGPDCPEHDHTKCGHPAHGTCPACVWDAASSLYKEPEVLTELSFLDARRIARRVEDLASVINQDYKGKTLHMVVVLKGAWMFASDLARHLSVPCTVDFISVKSYQGFDSLELEITHHLTDDIRGRNVLVVDDILDTGRTLHNLSWHLKRRGPANLEFAVLLDKPDGRRIPFAANYVGFVIPKVFVYGYGMDLNQEKRNLRHIAVEPKLS